MGADGLAAVRTDICMRNDEQFEASLTYETST